MALSEKAEEIMEALWVAVEEGRNYCPVEEMKIAQNDPAYQELKGQALIEVRDDRVYLRPEGREEAKKNIRRHRLAERLMMDVLNIPGKAGDDKACEFEHLLQEGVESKVCATLNHPVTCPHGKAIPPGECCQEARSRGDLGVVSLTELKAHEKGEIAYLQTADSSRLQKLMALGVLPGNSIQLIQSYPSYVFRVGFSEFAIDETMARDIFVRRSG